MVNGHPASMTLAGFLQGTLSWSETKKVVLHLLRGCDRCKQEMEPAAAPILGSRWPEREPTPEEDAAYDAAISEACRRVLETLREEKRRLPGKLLENLARRGREVGVAVGRL